MAGTSTSSLLPGLSGPLAGLAGPAAKDVRSLPSPSLSLPVRYGGPTHPAALRSRNALGLRRDSDGIHRLASSGREPSRSTGDREGSKPRMVAPPGEGRWERGMQDREPAMMKRLLDRLLAARARREG